MKRIRRYLIFTIILLMIWLPSIFFTVDQNEFVYLTQFGKPLRMLSGDTEAGLHVKLPWPIDTVLRVDRRVQIFDLPTTESLTRDADKKTVDKTLAVDAFVTWRIPNKEALDRFIRTIGSIEQARKLMTPQLVNRLGAVISNQPMERFIQVVSEEEIRKRNEMVRQQLLGIMPIGDNEVLATSLQDQLLANYGIEIVDIRLRRLSYPESVRSGIAERIRSERMKKVAEYQSEGEKLARDIVSTAERDAAKIIADAKSKKQIIEGQADVQADKIRNEAYTKDQEFFLFLQKLKSYQTMLSESKDLLLLSTKHPFFDLLLHPSEKKISIPKITNPQNKKENIGPQKNN